MVVPFFSYAAYMNTETMSDHCLPRSSHLLKVYMNGEKVFSLEANLFLNKSVRSDLESVRMRWMEKRSKSISGAEIGDSELPRREETVHWERVHHGCCTEQATEDE